jgi:hypothetical protein
LDVEEPSKMKQDYHWLNPLSPPPKTDEEPFIFAPVRNPTTPVNKTFPSLLFSPSLALAAES